MEEKNILLSELLNESSFSIELIKVIARGNLFIAKIRCSDEHGTGTVFLYPSKRCGSDLDYPSNLFKDAVLEERICEATGSPYFCWKRLISDDYLLIVDGDTFIPDSPFGNIVFYPSALLNSGLLYTNSERDKLLSMALRTHE